MHATGLKARAAAIVVAGLTFLASPLDARAATKVATFATPGCAAAPEWRIGYRFYFRDTAGRVLERDAGYEQALQAAEDFAADVGELSECGARVSIDVFDEGDAAWPAERGIAAGAAGRFPDDAAAFRASGDYDHGFYRLPSDGPGCGGSTDYIDAEFPVGTGTGCGPQGTPWRMLLMHEWLHAMVFAHPRADWPTGDVHGGCALGYTEPCLVNRRYFGDLMTGRVLEGGVLRGIRNEQWSDTGLLWLQVEPSGLVLYQTEVGRTLPVTLSYQRAGQAETSDQVPPLTPQDLFRAGRTLPNGSYRVCLRAGAEGRHHPAGELCVDVVITNSVNTAYDSDGDGIFDGWDPCPTLPGPGGCPAPPAGPGTPAADPAAGGTEVTGSATVAPAASSRLRTPARRISLSALRAGRLRQRFDCARACRVSARLVVDAAMARRLGLRRLNVGSGLRELRGPGSGYVTVRLTPGARRALGRRPVAFTLRATLVAGGQLVRRSSRVTARR